MTRKWHSAASLHVLLHCNEISIVLESFLHQVWVHYWSLISFVIVALINYLWCCVFWRGVIWLICLTLAKKTAHRVFSSVTWSAWRLCKLIFRFWWRVISEAIRLLHLRNILINFCQLLFCFLDPRTNLLILFLVSILCLTDVKTS